MHERRFKVRSDLKDRKYFHISFPQTGFPCTVKCRDILLGYGVWGQGSVSLDKSGKPLLHRTVPINQESTSLLTSQGSVWGRSRISLPSAIKCEGPSGQPPHCPRAQLLTLIHYWAPLCGPVVKNHLDSTGDAGLNPGLERSPGEGNGNPLQYSCLENPKDRVAWWATVHGVTKSQTRLST